MRKFQWFLGLLPLLLSAGCSSTAEDSLTSKQAPAFDIQQNEEIIPGIYWEEDIISVYEPAQGGIWYPRLSELANGTLLCGFDTNENGGNSVIKIMRSTDGGLKWNNKVQVSEFPDLGCANASIIELPDGDIWISYRANGDVDNGYYSSIRNSVSHDGGQTWAYHSLITEEFGNGGVYEPHFGWIGDQIAIFYANDSLNTVTNHTEQNIEFKLWQNGAWSEKHIASDGTETHSRDGMPVWDKMDDGRYALVAEATNEPGYPFVIQMKTSPDGFDWSEGFRNIYIPYTKIKKAGAPYIVTLPDGRLCVSFQTDDEAKQTGDHASYMKLMISLDKEGQVFSEPFTPFMLPDGYCGNWNGLHVNDTYLFAVTSANHPADGVYIRRASLVPKTNVGQNIVWNGDFQFKNLQNWRVEQNAEIYHADFPGKFEKDNGNTYLSLKDDTGDHSELTLIQEISGLQEGLYTFRMKAAGDAGNTVKVILTQGSDSIEMQFSLTADMELYEQKEVKMQSGMAILAIVIPGEAQPVSFDDIELICNATGSGNS